MIGIAIALIFICANVGVIGLVLAPLAIDQTQMLCVLNNNASLCFQTWKYVPPIFGMQLISTETF